ncbi:G5 domain-containing protein [Streptococcus sp. DTU_2020_1001019_1_SI_AUS_MUR_006]|uniref:G5 domain-containing protein n=1 Tax=Streptococcus sp. DTU_2020_1001019_1_SI_AUS_MUR_006 TaxID=3077584 RepID=UPI0028E397C8|nr:G5 domain-containing protein [Streptococcus sp. DTU_2020_1001019_1_SI_AUS_MUR_006]WNS72114.1 G5 domain-containing protein [Streptococcus sp. DTU_2020_1001019_1_SI_AUS_MUR_006]
MKDIFNKRQRFSIRKFSFGVASVLIGVSLFAPTQGVLASTENNKTGIEVNSENDNSLPTVEIKEEVQNISEHRDNASSEIDAKELSTVATSTTILDTSGDKETVNSTATTLVAGEDRSSAPEVRAASNPSELKKYELTDEYANQIKAGIIGSEGDQLDSLLVNGPKLNPEGYTDDDYLKDKEEVYIYEKNGKKYVGYNSHPLLDDTDGDGIIDSNEKPDEKLKWNVSERDMIMFMELAYRDDKYIDRVLDHKTPLTEAELYKKNGESKPRYEYMMMNRELGPYWERKKSYHTSSGLDAVLFETKSDFLYLPNGTAQVLAFRGTSDSKDIGADITLGTGSNPKQAIEAEEIMRELAKDKSITNLYLTGHSLGGYLVQRAMVEAYQLAYSDSRVMSPKEQLDYRNFYNNILKKGTTFNAPKVRTGLFSSSEFWQKGLDSKKIAKSGKLTHYIVDNDSTIGKSVSNDSDVVINVGRTSRGHSSRSYFEADMINRRPEFISGKRISLDGIGYQDKKITTDRSVEKVGETVVYSKRGDDIIKSTTVSIKDPDTGQITKNALDQVFKENGAKDKVETTEIPSPKKYVKDDTREKGQANVEVPGKTGKQTVTTTYSVNPNTGDLIEHVGQPVVKQPAIETVVKVAAKDEVEYIKRGADVVKKTTSYTVNSKTGSLTSTEKQEVVNRGGAKDIVEYNSVEPKTVYLKDENSPKGTDTVQFSGKSGQTKVTTTYSVDPVNGTLTPSKGKPEVVTIPIARVVKVGAKDKVETTEIPSPKKYVKDDTRDKGQDNVEEAGQAGSSTVTTTYEVNPSDGTITERVGKPVVVNPTETIVKVPAKDKVVETSIEPEVEYVRAGEREVGTPDDRVEGAKGKIVTTTTYDVDSHDGHITEHVGTPVVTPAGKIIVKVGAKTKVEQSKDSEGRDVIDTTTYEVDPKTGKVTPTTVRTYGKTKEPTVDKRVVPSPVVYEKDDTKEKGTAPTTVKGEDGEDTITTIYTVDPNTGKIIVSEGKPVRTKEPTNTVVKVAAKDRVVETPIEPEVEYVRDGERDVDTSNERIEGAKGKIVTTTTYDVDSNDGHITEHVDTPVVTPAGKTIVKVGAKTKVEQSKDSEGHDVIDTTTYEVDPKTGKVTPTTVRTYGKTKAPTVEKRVVPSPVVYEKDDTKEKGTVPTTVKGEDGEDTITTIYTVDPNTGKITASEGQPVRTKEPTNTVVKVAAKDKVVEASIEPEVEYVRDGEREVDTPNERVEGAKGKTVTTTTYDVDSNDGHITEHVGTPVVSPAGKTIVKVGAKTKVEQSKDSEGRDVIDITTYEVDPKTGKVTPTTVRTYGTTKEPTVEKRVVPSLVVYEKDDTKEKGTAPTTVKGEDGEDTITTTYTVDPNTGKITASEGQPVRTKEATNTIVKVPAKDKVETTKLPSPKKYVKDDTRDKDQPNVEEAGQTGSSTITTTYSVDPTTGAITETVGKPVVVNPTETIVKVAAKDKVVEASIEPEVEYVRDGEREVDTPNERVEGAKGKTVTTTTYDVDSNDGHITEHVGTPVVSPAGKTIVKVGAKTKVEQSKDSEGRDVIDITTYEVDPKTGKVTPTTVRTYGKTKEPKVELEQDPKTGDVTVTPKKPDGSTYPPGTKVEISGKDGNPIVVTIDEDGKGKVPNSDLPNVEKTGTGKITEPGKSSVEVPKVTTFENDALSGSIALPELMIEVRWNDEDGNVLKSSVKTGDAGAAGHGVIPRYEFLRTEVDDKEPIITHIFRKVSSNTIQVLPVTPDTNGDSSQSTDPLATPIQDAVSPNANHRSTTATIDKESKSNGSQNVLPRLGTESSMTLASLGLLGMLSGLGLAFGKKKED